MGSDGFIPLAEPVIRGNEWKYVKDCLDTAWVSSVGSYVDDFERSVAGAAGVDHAVATVNGTAALHTALLVAGIGPGQEVLVPALSFVAPANVVRYVGAHPVFVDAEPEFGQMNVDQLVEFLQEGCQIRDGAPCNQATGRRVTAVLAVHLLGHPVDMDPLLEVARRHGLLVIEDAAESLGARYRDRPLGGLGDLGCFSFNGNKVVTCGGGGALVTNRREWAERARYLTTQARDDEVEYLHNQIGYNYRLTNLQAAMGLAQMEQLDEYVAAKRRIAGNYRQALASWDEVQTPTEREGAFSTFWLYTVRLADRKRSRALMRHLKERNIQTRPLWHPLHSLPPYRDEQALPIEVADQLHDRCLSLPCSVNLTGEQQQRVIEGVRDFLGS